MVIRSTGRFPIDKYIVDFICRELRLIVEVDRYSHRFKSEEDKSRDQKPVDLDYKTVRFLEQEVIHDLKKVIKVLEHYLPEE